MPGEFAVAPVAEPQDLRKLERVAQARWGIVSLIDFPEDALHRVPPHGHLDHRP